MFQPQKITYEEDLLRKEFFKDHPWELARPRMMIEDDGRDFYQSDWSNIEQENKMLSGESVVQREQWLLQNDASLTRAQAYDQARKEFYALRLQQDVERRVAKEEAMSTGAYFGKSALEYGMQLEDKEWNVWRQWAIKESEAQSHRFAGAYTGFDSDDEQLDVDLDELKPAIDDGADEARAETLPI